MPWKRVAREGDSDRLGALLPQAYLQRYTAFLPIYSDLLCLRFGST